MQDRHWDIASFWPLHVYCTALAIAIAGLLSVTGIALCGPLARDSRMPLLERQALIDCRLLADSLL